MDELGSFERRGDLVDLRYERRFARPVETVWAALTEPARLEDWLGSAVVEPFVGGRFELFTDRPRPMFGRIVTWQPPALLEFSWDTGDAPATLVRCELTREGDGTLLVFRHNGIASPWMGLVLPGWHIQLERLGSLMAGRLQPDSMARWRDLQKIYLDHYRLEGVMIDPPAEHGYDSASTE
jgi:uncharacterized protein YndB with AHSA1/START domain